MLVDLVGNEKGYQNKYFKLFRTSEVPYFQQAKDMSTCSKTISCGSRNYTGGAGRASWTVKQHVIQPSGAVPAQSLVAACHKHQTTERPLPDGRAQRLHLFQPQPLAEADLVWESLVYISVSVFLQQCLQLMPFPPPPKSLHPDHGLTYPLSTYLRCFT